MRYSPLLRFIHQLMIKLRLPAVPSQVKYSSLGENVTAMLRREKEGCQ
jgi:hypothetical protein